MPTEEKYKNRGVSACAVCDGALPRFRNHPLAVIGGGDSAVEEATYLTKFASKVYLVHRRDKLRASKIMAERAEANPKIEIQWNRVVDEVLGNDRDGVTGVRLKSTVGEPDLELPIAGFFLGIGHTPNTAFLHGELELTDKGTLSGRRRGGPARACRGFSPPATWPTTIIARRSPPPAPAAWRPWTPNAGWRESKGRGMSTDEETLRRPRSALARSRAARKSSCQGWSAPAGDSKAGFSFLEINDGSSLGNIQVVAPAALPNYESESSG